MMCEIYNLRLEKGAFRGFQLEIELSEMLQYYLKTLQVFFLCTAIYYHVIQIDDAVGQIQLSQCVLHKMLECRGCVTQSERHPSELIETQVANHECGILLRLWGHTDLPKSTFEVHSGEMCSSDHTLQHFLYPGERIGILLCPHVESSEVNAEWKGPILLLYQHHSVTPGRLTRSNSASLQHISQGCMHFFQ